MTEREEESCSNRVGREVMDTLNSCDWCERVEGGVKSYEEEVVVFGVIMDWHLRW